MSRRTLKLIATTIGILLTAAIAPPAHSSDAAELPTKPRLVDTKDHSCDGGTCTSVFVTALDDDPDDEVCLWIFQSGSDGSDTWETGCARAPVDIDSDLARGTGGELTFRTYWSKNVPSRWNGKRWIGGSLTSGWSSATVSISATATEPVMRLVLEPPRPCSFYELVCPGRAWLERDARASGVVTSDLGTFSLADATTDIYGLRSSPH